MLDPIDEDPVPEPVLPAPIVEESGFGLPGPIDDDPEPVLPEPLDEVPVPAVVSVPEVDEGLLDEPMPEVEPVVLRLVSVVPEFE